MNYEIVDLLERSSDLLSTDICSCISHCSPCILVQ